ncbi:MAG: methyl-accepting chemotaxis protein [Pseudomonadota bacterium]
METQIVLMDTMAQEIAARNDEYATMDAIGPVIVDETEALLRATTERKLELSGEAAAASFNTKIATGTLAGLAILFGLVLSVVIVRRVTRALNAAVDDLGRLSAGDLEIVVEGADEETELGRMARAMSAFRDNALEARRLEAEAKEKEARDRAAEEARAKAAAEEKERRAREEIEAEEAARREREEREAREKEAEAVREKAMQEEQERARRKVVDELQQAVGAVVDAAASGDLSRRIEAKFDDPTLARLAEQINDLISGVEVSVTAASDTLAHVANGDLTAEMKGEFAGVFADLQRDMNGTIANLTKIVRDIASSGEGVQNSSAEISTRSDDLARRTEKSAASIEETAAAVHEITESLKSVSRSVREATTMASSARSEAEKSGEIVGSAVEAMEQVSNSSKKIASITNVIEDISFQINLLALNAGVEAARAGEAGRGFSVVAAEVRALAQRTSEAVKDITDLIQESSVSVDRGAELVGGASEALTSIATGVVEISDRMSDISGAVDEQANGVEGINNAVSDLDRATQQNAAMFQEITAASHSLKRDADTLRSVIGGFRTTDEAAAPRQAAA